MTVSRQKNSVSISANSVTSEIPAEIVSHPHRLKGLLAEKRSREEQLVFVKDTAIEKIQQAIAEAKKIPNDSGTDETTGVIAELNLIMKEILPIQPTNLPHPDSLNALTERLHRAMVALMYCNSTALLKQSCQNLLSTTPR